MSEPYRITEREAKDRMQYYGSRPKLGEMLLQHVIVFLLCVVFPGLTTWMAPASWLNFQRNETGVRCTTWTCVFFVVPYKIQHVNQVTEIGSRKRSASTKREVKNGRTTNNNIHVDGEGHLQIHGPDDQLVEVSVTPVSLPSVVSKSQDFLNANQPASKTMFVIANWKFGALMGGILTLFTVLYVVGYCVGFFKLIIATVKKLFFRAPTTRS